MMKYTTPRKNQKINLLNSLNTKNQQKLIPSTSLHNYSVQTNNIVNRLQIEINTINSERNQPRTFHTIFENSPLKPKTIENKNAPKVIFYIIHNIYILYYDIIARGFFPEVFR